MYKHLLTWLRGRDWNPFHVIRMGRPPAANLTSVLAAVAALRAYGITITPCGDEFQHWKMGDFTMTEAEVIHFAVSRGMIAGS